ncbi:MAG: nucleotidyltransferase domain-containing protein [Candidatus Aenigmarchaeota archaeon]|nr:nucleotidyltransferase domain-containing protein [Candidatus Aenigmarchaeota archaeon]
MAIQTAEIRNFLKKVKKKFSPSKIILFGSRARGDYLLESDYDLIIVSDAFKKYDFTERIGHVMRLSDGSVSLDVICYTEDEFEKKKKELGTVREAVKEGVVLKV